MMMFSLDLFGGESFPRQKLEFLILNIPALLLSIALVIAWKNEIIGGMIYILKVCFVFSCKFAVVILVKRKRMIK